MFRTPRVYDSGAIFHVIAKGNDQRNIFFDDEDYQEYLLILQGALSVQPFHVLAYALMSNHVHLLVEVGYVPLDRIIKLIHQRYAQYLHQKNNTSGHVFQVGYDAILVDLENYFFTLIQHINMNPYRAGLVTNINDYHWIGHYEIISGNNYVINQSKLLGYLAESPDEAMKKYLVLMGEGMPEVHLSS